MRIIEMKNQYVNQLILEQKKQCEEKIREYEKNLDPDIKKALRTNNVNLLRSIIKLDLNEPDLSFEQLMTKTLFLAEQDLPIFVPFEISKLHADIEIDKKYWTKDYFSTQRSYLTVNFALERMVHLIDVKRYLQPTQENAEVVVNMMEHPPKGMGERMKMEFEKFKQNPTQWIKENPKRAIGIVVVLAILAWCFL